MTGFGHRHDNHSSSSPSTRSRSARKTPSLDLSLSSREASPEPAAPTDADSSDSLSIDGRASRMRVAGPCCFKQPTLSEVLSNTAPPPYTLSAFMAYLSQNHCLETLEFTMDASRYRKHYNAVVGASGTAGDSKDCAFVRKLWQKLLDAYIVPNGPREVNLPCSVRDKLLTIPNRRTPPPPETLDPAVNIVHELMQESVLVPFLSECQSTHSLPSEQHQQQSWDHPSASVPNGSHHLSLSTSASGPGMLSLHHNMSNHSHQMYRPHFHHSHTVSTSTPNSTVSSPIAPQSPPFTALFGSISAPTPPPAPSQPQSHHHSLNYHLRNNHHSEENLYFRGSLDERLHRRTHPSRSKRSASPPSPADHTHPHQQQPQHHPRRTVSPFSASLGWSRSSPPSSQNHPSANSWASGSGDSLVEDSGSSTPASWRGTPMTPPTTPPAGEATGRRSPKRDGRDSAGTSTSSSSWRRMTGGIGRGLGFGKKKSESMGW